jgi:HlyD family secretion protein
VRRFAAGALVDPATGSSNSPAGTSSSEKSADSDDEESENDEEGDDEEGEEDADENSVEDEEEEEEESADDDKPAGSKQDKAKKSDDQRAASDEKQDEASEVKAASKSDENKSDKKPTSSEQSKEESKSDAKTDAKADEAAKKPATFKVEAKDLKIEVEAEGVFVAEECEEVALRPETWATFKVLEAVPHGKRVRKGDVLVKFDDKDIEKAIDEKSLELRAGELALMAAEEEFPRIEKSIALNYEEAKRQYEEAKDEKKRFDETMRDMSEKMAQYYLQSSEQQFQNANEEYEQLKKMYDADELTEETEEIVLKRQKFQVEAAKFFLEYAKINHQYTTEISIPQREESLKTAVEMAKIQFDRASMAKSLGMNQQRYEMEKMREARAKAVDSHAKLLSDRRLMTLKAPADGIVYYGRQVNGRWIEVSSMESKLIPFGAVVPNSVVVTIVKDRPMYVETAVGEKDLPTVKAEQPALVTPAADGEVELKAVVEQIADVPGAGNKFPVRLDLKSNDIPDWLMPGMTGKAKITVYDVKDAIVIPADLLQTDENDPKQKYVMLEVEDEKKPVRRDVKIGKKKEKDVEIVKGLKAGDVIVKGAKDEAKDDDEQGDDEQDGPK